MPTTLRQYIENKSTTSQDVTVGLIMAVAGTNGELYVLETDPANPTLPTSLSVSAFNTQYSRDASDQTVTIDTGTPANNAPLPVALYKDGGAEYSFNAGATDAGTQRVTLASDSPTPALDGLSVLDFALNNNSSVNITTGAYVELIASTSGTTKEIEILDTGGSFYYLATGAAASETDLLVIPPGGNGRIPVEIASGTRISIKAIDGTANAGFTGVNLYG